MGRWGMALSPFSIGPTGFRPVGTTFPAANYRGYSFGYLCPALCCEISHHAFYSTEGIRSFVCQSGDCDDDSAVQPILRSNGSLPDSLDAAQQVPAN
jgi:hypothetical protein